MKLKGLTFRYAHQTWVRTYWPEDRDWVQGSKFVLYDEGSHSICLPAPYYAVSNKMSEREFFDKNFPEARQITKEEEAAILKRYDQAEKNRETAKRRREFEKSIIGDFHLSDTRIAHRFLQGENTVPGDGQKIYGLTINGNFLKDHSALLLYRLNETEFLLGVHMTQLSKNPGACVSRIMTVLLTYNNFTFWPTNYTGWRKEEDMKTPYAGVLNYCYKILSICQLKMPTARDKDSYNEVFRETCELYQKARVRWKRKSAQIDELIDIYGDIPKMKEYNAAFRMLYIMNNNGE